MMFGLTVEEPPPVDVFYEGDRLIAFGDYLVSVVHTPGHCPGGVCLAISKQGDPSPPHLFVGDTLFAGSIGRTDLPGGDYETLLRAITGTLFTFPDESIVYSGHGPETTIGREKQTNPFVLEYPTRTSSGAYQRIESIEDRLFIEDTTFRRNGLVRYRTRATKRPANRLPALTTNCTRPTVSVCRRRSGRPRHLSLTNVPLVLPRSSSSSSFVSLRVNRQYVYQRASTTKSPAARGPWFSKCRKQPECQVRVGRINGLRPIRSGV